MSIYIPASAVHPIYLNLNFIQVRASRRSNEKHRIKSAVERGRSFSNSWGSQCFTRSAIQSYSAAQSRHT